MRNRQPDLKWDFLYASCENGTNKTTACSSAILRTSGSTRLARCTSAITRTPTSGARGASASGPDTILRPERGWPRNLQRETSVFELLFGHDVSRLDRGSRTLRRIVTAQAPERSLAYHLGVTIMGPAMAGFDAFIETRAAQLRQGHDARVAVAFLGRDGFLPHLIWRELHGETASYVEINRRVSLVGSADTIAPLVELIGQLKKIDAAAFSDIVKIRPNIAVIRFFSTLPAASSPDRSLPRPSRN